MLLKYDFGIGSLLLIINLAPDFILSLKLECSLLRPVLMILLACDEHLSVVGYKIQEGYFLTPRADKRCLKCVDLGCRCEAHNVIVPSCRFYLSGTCITCKDLYGFTLFFILICIGSKRSKLGDKFKFACFCASVCTLFSLYSVYN